MKKIIACATSLGLVWFTYWSVSTYIDRSEVEMSNNANSVISEMFNIELRAVEYKIFNGEWPESLKTLSEGEEHGISTKFNSSYALDVSGDTLTVSFHDETKGISRAIKEKLGESVDIINEDKTVTISKSQIMPYDILSFSHRNIRDCPECAVLPEELNTDLSVKAGEVDMSSLPAEKLK